MASLKTHLQYTTVVSGAGASALYSAGILTPQDALMCWAFGVLGGVLPDVDSDDPKGAGIIFGLFSFMACAVTLFATITTYPLLMSWGACALVFVVVQFGIRNIFVKYTQHRGVFHSIIGGIMFMLMVASGSGLLGIDATTCWFFALFVGLGYLLHLFLDEAFKVNLMGDEYKKSFGGAIKPLDLKNIKASLFMIVITAAAFYYAPESKEFVSIAFNSSTYSDVASTLY